MYIMHAEGEGEGEDRVVLCKIARVVSLYRSGRNKENMKEGCYTKGSHHHFVARTARIIIHSDTYTEHHTHAYTPNLL